MGLTVPLTAEQEERLRSEARSSGLSLVDYARQRLLGESASPRRLTARELLALAPEERRPYLEEAAAALSPEYDADLAKPPAERELTAFTALDGEPFHES